MASRVLRRSVDLFIPGAGFFRYGAGTGEGQMAEGHAARITNPKAWEEVVEAGEEPSTAPAEDDLTGKSIPELRALAHEEGIELGNVRSKADITEAIRNARLL